MRAALVSLMVAAPLWAALDLPPPLRGSALENLLDDGAPLRGTLTGLRDRAETLGRVTDTIIPFSDSPLHTNLEEPRFVVSVSPKLYYAAIPRPDGSVDFEFQAWKQKEFVFGKISGFGTDQAKVEVADMSRCKICHNSLGPLFTDRPWTNVNGANSPIGTYLSFAMLSKLIDRDPARYARYAMWLAMGPRAYDATFGNLAPEPAIALGPIRFHGTPLFALRGSFDLDANTRRSHYLLLTHQIREALSGSQRKEFVRGLVEQALLGVAYPSQIEYLFAWDQYLTAWIKKVPELATLPAAAHSPVLKNYQPLFDNPALVKKAGITDDKVHQNPVGALIQLSDYVKTNRLSAYPPEELPSSGQTFIELKPNHNGGADTALELLCDADADVQSWIREAATQTPLAQAFQMPEWGRLWDSDEFPSLTQLRHALAIVLPAEPVAYLAPVSADEAFARPSAFPEALRKGHKCLSCHGGSKDAETFPWDPANLTAWKQNLGVAKPTPQALKWAKATFEKLDSKNMPPKKSNEVVGFDWEQEPWKGVKAYLRERLK